MDKELGHRILTLRERIVSHFDAGDWEEIGFLTGHSDIIKGHSRLLRSLSWGDEDYAGNVLSVLGTIAERDLEALNEFERLLNREHPEEAHYVSARPADRKLTFAPHVFEVPDVVVQADLVAIMMPFGAEFDPVHDAIKDACRAAHLKSLRADDIWEESTIIQDIFNLLLRARIVVVDFTGRNPNVMYETGIAHTLGKLVVPISQSVSDVPFDMAHHRCLRYLPNIEGYLDLSNKLTAKLTQVSA
jgi:AbiJ N-terminal domain 5